MKQLFNSVKKLLAITAMISLGACVTQQQQQQETPEAPAPEASAAAPAAAPTKSSDNSSYGVERGDNLWNIAGQSRIYGNPYQWPLIYKANSGKIKDADLIYPGQNFDINRSPSQSEINAAVRHAKTRGAWSLGSAESSDQSYLSR